MRHPIHQHHPPIHRSPFPRPRSCHVHDLVVAQSVCARGGKRACAGVDRQDAARRARGVLEAAEGDEENGAEENPRGVEQREAAKHAGIIRIVTRGEIEEKLVAIVQQEKNISQELLRPETPLAEAGIDSLDSLTILFAIEEQFRISIPDDRARAVTTFGDLIDVVQDLLPAA